jgi:molybdenum cofactor guanylyltransferase
VLAAVLAGGGSTRFGRPKATAPLGGRALIEFPLAALAETGLETVVVAKPGTPLPPLGVPVWLEPAEPAHPLAGITTALARSGGRPVLACACDLPFVSAALLKRLAEGPHPLVVPKEGGRLHPLLARYAPSLLEPLTEALAARRSMHDTIEELDPVIVSERDLAQFGDPARLLFNVNTPEDLARAEGMLA